MYFNIKALRAGEPLTALQIEAADAMAATRAVEAQGYTVLSVSDKKGFAATPARRERFPLVLFSQELLALIEAGLPLLEAMQTLAEKEHRPAIRQVIEAVIAQLFEGRSFSQALNQRPDAFPALYVASVRAAERTGDLPEAISRFISYQTQLDSVKKKLVSASIYPVLLFAVGGLVTLFLLMYVVPKFSRVFEDMGGDIPLLSQLLIQWGVFMEAHAMTIGLLSLALVVLAVLTLRQPATQAWIMQRLWAIPAIGEQMRIYQLARFYRTLGMLLNGGIPVSTALSMVEGLLAPALRAQLDKAALEIREGKAISQAMESNGLTTPVALRMLRVGERSGRMGEMMERIARFYDDEMARWVEWFTRLFEPILMTLIGVMIGAIVVLMYMPIFELAGSIQ